VFATPCVPEFVYLQIGPVVVVEVKRHDVPAAVPRVLHHEATAAHVRADDPRGPGQCPSIPHGDIGRIGAAAIRMQRAGLQERIAPRPRLRHADGRHGSADQRNRKDARAASEMHAPVSRSPQDAAPVRTGVHCAL
jgi:hypothetical protein